MPPDLKNYPSDPKYHGRDAIQHASFDQSLEGRSQKLEEIMKVEASHSIARNKEHPPDKARRKHLRGALEKTDNRYQQKQNEQSVRCGIALKSVRLETWKTVGRHQSGNHHNVEKSAQVNTRPERGAGGTGASQRVSWNFMGSSRTGRAVFG